MKIKNKLVYAFLTLALLVQLSCHSSNSETMDIIPTEEQTPEPTLGMEIINDSDSLGLESEPIIDGINANDIWVLDTAFYDIQYVQEPENLPERYPVYFFTKTNTVLDSSSEMISYKCPSSKTSLVNINADGNMLLYSDNNTMFYASKIDDQRLLVPINEWLIMNGYDFAARDCYSEDYLIYLQQLVNSNVDVLGLS